MEDKLHLVWYFKKIFSRYIVARAIWRVVKPFILTPKFLHHYINFKNKSPEHPRFELQIKDIIPILGDWNSRESFDEHYVYHIAWAIRKVRELNPKIIADFSSSHYFVAVVSSFTKVDSFNYRKSRLVLDNVNQYVNDLTSLKMQNASLDFITCMHVIEHVGLGRYGDCLDYDGDKRVANELDRVLSIGGTLLLVLPVGEKARICFNAHRIYTYELVLSMFRSFNLIEFAYISDKPDHAYLKRYQDSSIVGHDFYGCGCFHLVKKH